VTQQVPFPAVLGKDHLHIAIGKNVQHIEKLI
jgi:hypothetical protein